MVDWFIMGVTFVEDPELFVGVGVVFVELEEAELVVVEPVAVEFANGSVGFPVLLVEEGVEAAVGFGLMDDDLVDITGMVDCKVAGDGSLVVVGEVLGEGDSGDGTNVRMVTCGVAGVDVVVEDDVVDDVVVDSVVVEDVVDNVVVELVVVEDVVDDKVVASAVVDDVVDDKVVDLPVVGDVVDDEGVDSVVMEDVVVGVVDSVVVVDVVDGGVVVGSVVVGVVVLGTEVRTSKLEQKRTVSLRGAV